MYINELTPLNITLYPIIRTTRTKNGKKVPFYQNCDSGKESFDIEELKETGKKYQIIDKLYPIMYGASIQYDEKLDMICIIFCRIDLSREKRDTTQSYLKREWTILRRAYVTRDKKLFLNIIPSYSYRFRPVPLPNEFLITEWTSENLNYCNLYKKSVIINSSKVLQDEDGNNSYYQYDILKPFHDFFGEIVPIAGNKMITLDTMNSVLTFMKYQKPKNTSNNKYSEILNSYLKYELPNIEIPSNFKERNVNFGWKSKYASVLYENVEKFAIIQRVEQADEPMCVLRSFFKSPYSDFIIEGGRIYITKTQIISSRCIENGKFMYQKLLDKSWNWNFPIENFDKEVTRDTYLEYFGEIIEGIDYDDRGLAIWSFLKYPITETLYKNPLFTDLMKCVFKLCILSTPINVLKVIFGPLNVKEKNIYKFLGMNKYQLEQLMPLTKNYMPRFFISYYWENGCYTPGCGLKSLLGCISRDSENISSVDNNTTDWAINILKKVFKKTKKITLKESKIETTLFETYKECQKALRLNIKEIMECVQNTVNTYNVNVAEKMIETIVKFCDKTIPRTYYNDYYHNYYTYHQDFSIVYNDFLNMVSQTNCASTIKPYFNTVEELGSMHETMVHLINSQKEELESEGWKKRQTLWKKFEFSDKHFTIIAPTEPKDLAEEGITLHHCVKSYIPKVSSGKTNVVFLRENNALDKPFYTIEIDNNNVIQQVHGLCNRNATLEIQEFVKRWAKEKKLKQSDYNKVR